MVISVIYGMTIRGDKPLQNKKDFNKINQLKTQKNGMKNHHKSLFFLL
ncbi:hypothetical protein ECSTECDG1313_2318 [Escherichia coli STEC_DG131-3]|nr:hypothetical protein ECSTECDG1313_2318 [Escherichia coli STEC_DG131-3]